jgi:hypothetical protein
MSEERRSSAELLHGDDTRDAFAGLVSRRQILQRASALGLGGLVLSALPVAERILASVPAANAATNLADATLQAFADTMIPGRKAISTDLGNEIHPLAIAGVHGEPGAVEADALLLFHDARIGFDAIEPAFLSDLSTRSIPRGGQFLDLPFGKRVQVCVEGLAPSNPSVQVWEAAAAVPFAALLAVATQADATIDTASGYQVMGHPGIAPDGYADYSYKKRLSNERTANGSLP